MHSSIRPRLTACAIDRQPSQRHAPTHHHSHRRRQSPNPATRPNTQSSATNPTPHGSITEGGSSHGRHNTTNTNPSGTPADAPLRVPRLPLGKAVTFAPLPTPAGATFDNSSGAPGKQ